MELVKFHVLPTRMKTQQRAEGAKVKADCMNLIIVCDQKVLGGLSPHQILQNVARKNGARGSVSSI